MNSGLKVNFDLYGKDFPKSSSKYFLAIELFHSWMRLRWALFKVFTSHLKLVAFLFWMKKIRKEFYRQTKVPVPGLEGRKEGTTPRGIQGMSAGQHTSLSSRLET